VIAFRASRQRPKIKTKFVIGFLACFTAAATAEGTAMDGIERITRALDFRYSPAARNRERGRGSGLRLESLEGRVLLSGSPSIQVMSPMNVAETAHGNAGMVPDGLGLVRGHPIGAVSLVEPANATLSATGQGGGIYLAGGVVSIGATTLPNILVQPGDAVSNTGATGTATGSLFQGNSGTGSGSAGQGTGQSAQSSGSAGQGTGQSAQSSGSAGQGTGQSAQSSGSAVTTTRSLPTTNNTNPATNSTNPTTNNTSPATTTNSASGSSSNNTRGGLPVVTGQLTLVGSTVAMQLPPSGGTTGAQTPLPGIHELVANGVGITQAQAPVAAVGGATSDYFAPVYTASASQVAKGTSTIAKAGDLVAVTGASLSPSSSLIGTSRVGALSSAQNGNTVSPASLSISVSVNVNISNPAPNSVFLNPDWVSSQPRGVALGAYPDTSQFSLSDAPDALDARPPAEIPGKGSAVIEALPADLGVTAPSTGPLIIHGATVSTGEAAIVSAGRTAIASTGGASPASGGDLPEIASLTRVDSVAMIDPTNRSGPVNHVCETIIFSGALAAFSANLAFGGAATNYRTIPWSNRPFSAARRAKGAGNVR
jgi:hypothetical protein